VVRIKNVRPGILIIADAGLKLAPGESIELETLTRQAEKAVADGLLARMDVASAAKSESRQAEKTAAKPKSKATTSGAENKEACKKDKIQPAKEEQHSASEENLDTKPENRSEENSRGQSLEMADVPK
jgi:flagellar biosynthesis GTPase FlhF